MDGYLQIRLLHRDRLSIRQVAERLERARDTVKKALVEPTPWPYTRTRTPAGPGLGPFTAAIDQNLESDRSVPKKRRHTAHCIFECQRAAIGG